MVCRRMFQSASHEDPALGGLTSVLRKAADGIGMSEAGEAPCYRCLLSTGLHRRTEMQRITKKTVLQTVIRIWDVPQNTRVPPAKSRKIRTS